MASISKIRVNGQIYDIGSNSSANITVNTSSYWAENSSYVPVSGEIVIYDDNDGTSPKLKVGNGSSTINNLPFMVEIYTSTPPDNASVGALWIDMEEESFDSAEGVEF